MNARRYDGTEIPLHAVTSVTVRERASSSPELAIDYDADGNRERLVVPLPSQRTTGELDVVGKAETVLAANGVEIASAGPRD